MTKNTTSKKETTTVFPLTFLNDDSEKTMVELGSKSLEYRKEDFINFMNETASEDVGEFSDYGLSIDSIFNEETEETEYVRFQLSWGGPSDELRYHPDGKIEYVFLDWFAGVGFDVTGEDWAQWSKDCIMDYCLSDA
tara:strand:- start:380 stop:790 length:411 start_codon:yes stop_codon:yes gene_type:complete